jgi:hypothetical protein
VIEVRVGQNDRVERIKFDLPMVRQRFLPIVLRVKPGVQRDPRPPNLEKVTIGTDLRSSGQPGELDGGIGQAPSLSGVARNATPKENRQNWHSAGKFTQRRNQPGHSDTQNSAPPTHQPTSADKKIKNLNQPDRFAGRTICVSQNGG